MSGLRELGWGFFFEGVWRGRDLKGGFIVGEVMLGGRDLGGVMGKGEVKRWVRGVICLGHEIVVKGENMGSVVARL